MNLLTNFKRWFLKGSPVFKMNRDHIWKTVDIVTWIYYFAGHFLMEIPQMVSHLQGLNSYRQFIAHYLESASAGNSPFNESKESSPWLRSCFHPLSREENVSTYGWEKCNLKNGNCRHRSLKKLLHCSYLFRVQVDTCIVTEQSLQPLWAPVSQRVGPPVNGLKPYLKYKSIKKCKLKDLWCRFSESVRKKWRRRKKCNWIETA